MKIVNGQRVYSLELTDAQLAVVHEGLMEVPFGRAATVVTAINEQLKAQVPEKSDAELMAEHHGRYGSAP